jgi:uncharacterized protein
VAYDTPTPGVRLAGTLTKPRDPGPHPAALLITGSGPHDRDETVMGHRPFLVLADHLTRLGLAVLRVDDRGVGGSTGDRSAATTADYASDSRASLAYLGNRPEIDSGRIGLIGHSEGAIIAPMIAADSPDVAWIALLAGPAVTGERILLSQADAISAASGVPDAVRADLAKLNEGIYAIVNREPDNVTAEREIQALIAEHEHLLAAAVGGTPTALLAGLKSQVEIAVSPWFRAFLRYDPAPALRNVRAPVLAMSGALDLQVPPSQSLPVIAAALEDGGNQDYEILKLPGLNHLFQSATTGSPAEYEAIEETIAPRALETLGRWILQHLAR